MKIRCDNGLCDRLAMIFSYLQNARRSGEKLEVCWKKNQECNGYYDDIFLPISDLVFTEDESNVDIKGWEPCRGFDPRDSFIYGDLRLNETVSEKVNTLTCMGTYIAIHVRRTDKLDPLKAAAFQPIPDQEYFDYIDRYKEPVFLAADCRETQDLFRQKYGDRIFCSSEIISGDQLRQTSLELAAIDLFVCIQAINFMGTRMSGFSRFIKQHRRARFI